MKVSCKSDVGRVRAANEDTCRYERIQASPVPVDVLVIADGMGGHQAGEVASRMAVEEFVSSVKTALRDSAVEDDLLVAVSEKALYDANLKVFVHGLKNPDCRGMGTTLTAALCYNSKMVISHVGDTRAYLVRNGRIKQLTRDHSLVGEMVRQGKLTERQAMVHPHSNILTNALGLSEEVQGDVFCHDFQPDDIVVLCSDGLSGLVESTEVERVVNEASHPEEACERLVELANERGGVDNITVIVLFNN